MIPATMRLRRENIACNSFQRTRGWDTRSVMHHCVLRTLVRPRLTGSSSGRAARAAPLASPLPRSGSISWENAVRVSPRGQRAGVASDGIISRALWLISVFRLLSIVSIIPAVSRASALYRLQKVDTELDQRRAQLAEVE